MALLIHNSTNTTIFEMFLSISVSTNVWDEDSQFKEIKFSHSSINSFEWTVNVRDCDEWPKDEWKQISAAMNGEKVGFSHLTPCIVSFGKMRKIGRIHAWSTLHFGHSTQSLNVLLYKKANLLKALDGRCHSTFIVPSGFHRERFPPVSAKVLHKAAEIELNRFQRRSYIKHRK